MNPVSMNPVFAAVVILILVAIIAGLLLCIPTKPDPPSHFSPPPDDHFPGVP
jgi:hypothetical protein